MHLFMMANDTADELRFERTDRNCGLHYRERVPWPKYPGGIRHCEACYGLYGTILLLLLRAGASKVFIHDLPALQKCCRQFA